jgi:adenylylsulfate kinase
MITVETRVPAAFAIWVTGLPASGKSTLVRSLTAQLAKLGIRPAVLESDVLRPILSPQAGYSTTERDSFYPS